MRKPSRLLFLSLAFLAFNISTLAQAGWSRDRGFHNWYFNGGYSSYGGYRGYGYRGSTVEGDYLRGMGAYLDALGNLHVNNAIASRHFQAAYTVYLQNQKLRVQTYYDIRDIHDNYMAKKRAKSAVAIPVSTRLTSGQRNVSTGAIAWPVGLSLEVFSEARAEVENLFVVRSERPLEAGEGTENYRRIQDAIEVMEGDLADNVEKMSATDFATAFRFLKTLSSEARFKP